MNFSNTNLPTRKLAIVTGAAEGCGLAIARNLCRDFDGDVFLTSRNVERGAEAVEKLNTEGFYPKYYRLDINDENQVLGLRDVVEKEYGKLDILVNNAATGYLSPTVAGMAEMAEATFRTNFKSTLRMCQVFIPVMNEGGRIVNMSSRMGRLCLVKNREMREKLVPIFPKLPKFNNISESPRHISHSLTLTRSCSDSATICSLQPALTNPQTTTGASPLAEHHQSAKAGARPHTPCQNSLLLP